MRTIALLAVAMLSGRTGAATEVRGTLSTLFVDREDPRAGEGVPSASLYELLAVEVSELALPGADASRVVLQGWGRLQLADDTLADNSADLGLLYLEAVRGPVRLRLGRQHLVAGVGRMQLVDGADARLTLGRYASAQAFLGFTVHPELRHRTDNWQTGGRLALNFASFGQTGELGLAYRMRRQVGALFRHELGADAVALVGPTQWVALAVVAPAPMELVEARLAGTWRPSDAWAITLDGERVTPALFLPLTSIFSVFSDAAHDAFGGEVRYTPSPYWAVDAAGHGLLLDNEVLGYRATLRGTAFREPSHRSAIGAELRRLVEQENGYLRARAFTTLQLREPLQVALDLFLYALDERVNGQPLSLIGQASVIYDILPALRVAGTLAGGTTPWTRAQLEGMVRLMYGWNVDLAREVGP